MRINMACIQDRADTRFMQLWGGPGSFSNLLNEEEQEEDEEEKKKDGDDE